MTFDKLFMIIKEKKFEQYHYIGNCSNLFDDDGNCITSHFRDASHFANYAELAEDETELEDREGNGELSEDEFFLLSKKTMYYWTLHTILGIIIITTVF